MHRGGGGGGGGAGEGGEKVLHNILFFFFFQLHNRITSCSRRESTEGTFSEQISEEVKSAAGQRGAESRSTRTHKHARTEWTSLSAAVRWETTPCKVEFSGWR